MKYSKHVRFSMFEQLKNLNSYSISLQLDEIENESKIENESTKVKQEN